jgi:hypothetical protein
MNASFGFHEGQRLLHASDSNRGLALLESDRPRREGKSPGTRREGGLGFSVDARGLRRDARHPSRRRVKDTHPVHVHEVDDSDELAVQGVRGQVDQADAPELDVALRDEERRAVG